MKSIINYIKFGRGIGARWLFLYAVVVSIVLGVSIKIAGYYATPTLQSIADQLLPIKIENGVIVEPENTVKAVKLDAEELSQYPIILDTTLEVIDTAGLRDGIYISKKAVYFVNDNQIRVHNFSGTMDLPKGDYTDMFKKIAVYVAWFMGLLALIVLFIVYLALTAFYAIFATTLSKVCKVNLDYPAGMRLSALAYIFTSVLLAILRLCGLNTPLWLYFIAVIALQTIILKLMTVKEEPSTKSVNKI